MGRCTGGEEDIDIVNKTKKRFFFKRYGVGRKEGLCDSSNVKG